MPTPETPTPGTQSPARARAREILAKIVARLNAPDDGSDQQEAWSILADELDRFAAQRRAEALLNYAQKLEATLPIANTTLTVDAAMRGIIEELRGPSPLQTGGGDAGKRAEFDRKTAINIRVQARYDELIREGKHGHYETMFRIIHEERRSSHREAMEAPFTKALVAEARTQGYRAGAKAMRDDCAKYAEDRYHETPYVIAKGIRALPIPHPENKNAVPEKNEDGAAG